LTACLGGGYFASAPEDEIPISKDGNTETDEKKNVSNTRIQSSRCLRKRGRRLRYGGVSTLVKVVTLHGNKNKF